MKSLCEWQKAYTVPITHHIILEQSKCVCVCACVFPSELKGPLLAIDGVNRFDVSCPSMWFYPVLAVR